VFGMPKKIIFWFFQQEHIDLLSIVEMDFVGRYDDQRILFCDEYLWLYHWTRKKGDTIEFQFQNFQRRKRIAIILLYFTVAFVVSVYHYFGKFTTWYAYVDTFITGIFFRRNVFFMSKKTGYFDN
jgi:hypothetical protein